ncbi:hypothetical protein QYR01_19365 [Brucella anthropi]|uniref:hypothetical protein n=1 Tax=Brucella anthropi TaxID=529 RepID=UPI002670DB6E|nr:hypothetical protein [Brucella anthropi]WKT93614.1 hypothetical protein QYR01_19365 [Brucella anthropi]
MIPETPYSPEKAVESAVFFKSMIETRTFKKEKLQEARVIEGLSLLSWAAAQGPIQIRLEALSVLGKAAEVSVPIATVVKPLIAKALVQSPPHTGDWGNADDRYYLAKAVSVARENWLGRYAARELALAGTSEVRSKEVWANLALANCACIAEAITEIAEGLNSAEGLAAEDPLTPFRRLTRVCDALIVPLRISELPAGRGLGTALRSLFNLSTTAATTEFVKVRETTALAAMDLVISILRLRAETLFDRDMYRAVSAPLNWWKPATPPPAVEDRANRATDLGVDALMIVARQGYQDIELRRAIVTALGNRRVNEISSRKANADHSLQPDISHWLATGQDLKTATKNEALTEIVEQEMDYMIARLAIERKRFQSTPLDIQQIGDEIEMFEPVQASIIKNVSTHLEIIGQSIDALLRRRGITVSPNRDELVKYDQRFHEAAKPMATSTEAKVIVPGAIKVGPGRSAIILVKPIVE